MNIENYFKSLTLELEGLKNRVRNFIEDAHWLTDGEWKESVMRAFLLRNLPQTIKVGRGFVLTKDGPTTQIDILFYKADSPVLFRDGDLVFLPPEAVLGAIEVKSKLTNTILDTSLNKLATLGRKICSNNAMNQEEGLKHGYYNYQLLLGLFAFESDVNNNSLLNKLRDINSDTYQVINLVCHGDSSLIKYWDKNPTDLRFGYNKWHSYKLNRMAPGYFIHNVLLKLSPQIIEQSEVLWFPSTSKEIYKEDEIESVHPMDKSWAQFQ